MKEIEIKGFTFRIKKMNALDLLSLRSQISFDNINVAKDTYSVFLKNIEVKVKDEWIQVLQGNNFYPAELENDIDMMSELTQFMMEYLKDVFHLSNTSNKETK